MRMIPLLALCGCAGAPISGIHSRGMPTPEIAQLRAAQIASPARYGRYRVLSSLCYRPSGSGYAFCRPDHMRPPTVGKPSTVQWSTELLAPRPALAAFLMVSFGDQPAIDLTPAGWPGCVMHVDSDGRNRWVINPEPGGILTLSNGRLWLDWTPPAALRGWELQLQPLFLVEQDGWVWAPGVEVWVGGS